MKLRKIATVVGIATFATAAMAAVTLDVNGNGFVGKGDVQLAFGWNNAALQSKAADVTFSYNSQDIYDVECYWETETGKGKVIVHDINVPKHVNINATVNFDARIKTQITGFNLNGFGDINVTGTVPVVGDTCPGNNLGTIIGVTQTGSTGGLYVNYGPTSVLLNVMPPA